MLPITECNIWKLRKRQGKDSGFQNHWAGDGNGFHGVRLHRCLLAGCGSTLLRKVWVKFPNHSTPASFFSGNQIKILAMETLFF